MGQEERDRMKQKKFFSLFVFFFALFCLNAIPAIAEQPLLQEGKKTVFQRVLSHPDAKLYSDPAASKVLKSPRTFTSFYVYEQQNNMLRVGVSTTKADGWVKLQETTNWPQAITMVFTDQMGRQPVLFFKDRQSLQNLCTADSIKDTVEQYVTLFNTKGTHIPDNLPVIATEPLEKDGQVAQKDFYLLPVLNIDTQFKESGTQLLQVACIDPGMVKQKKDSKNMTTGLVFVIDTTISMKPYIDKTRDVIRIIYDQLQQSSVKDHVSFAVVAFRSNVEKSPQTEYNTKVISDFIPVSKRAVLENLLQGLQESPASTHDFNEDSMAGVKAAVDSLSWDKVDAGVMLLLTDAGPLGAGDPTSKTGMSPEGMADYLHTNHLFLTAVHIKNNTPKGKANQPYAEKSYKELTLLNNGRSSYIAINAPTPEKGAEQFEKVSKTIADTYCNIVKQQMEGKKLPKPKAQDTPKNATPEEQAKQQSESIGYAMQLQFAGNQKGTTAPQVKNAWIADSDLVSLEENPQAAPVPVVYPAVLLTKSQLSTLRKQIKLIIDTAEEAFLQDSENFNFYEQLISAAAQMARDPSQFNSDPNANLAQKNVLLEALDGLPYKSQILRMQHDDWSNMSTGEQQEFIMRLKGLVQRYEEYDRDNTHWESFGSKNPNEWVYRVPLNMLP